MVKKYLVCNACQEGDDLNLYDLILYDDFESAKLCCQFNIIEDFGYETLDELKKHLDVEEHFYDSDVLYELRCDNLGGHKELYRVFVIKM